MTFVYVADHAREEGTHAPGVAASGCAERGCKAHSSDWRATPGSAANLHGARATHARTPLAEMAERRYHTEAHYVGYEMSFGGEPLARQPRLCKDALTWVRAQGYEVRLLVLSADVDTPPPRPGAKGHVPWTREARAEFDATWARAEGPLATCGLYLSPKGYRLVQPLAVPLEVLAGERALRLWIERLIAAGVWENARQVKDWTRHFRTPFHRRDARAVAPGFVDWSRMRAVDVEVPPASSAPKRPRSTPRPVAQVDAFEEACPPGWVAAADAVGAAVREHVPESWRDCYSAVCGALLEHGCPPAALPAVIDRLHRVDTTYEGWDSYLADRVGIARSTVARWCSVDASTGERPSVRGMSFLRRKYPAVAAVFDVLRASGALRGPGGATDGAEASVRRQLAAGAPAPVPVAEAVATIAREVADAYGVVVISAPPGTGKTRAVVARAGELPPIDGRAAPGSRVAVSAPRHDLAEQIASKLPRSLHLFSPPSLVRDGRPVCVYADSAKHLASGRQSVRRELCEGRGIGRCDAAEGCIAREGIEGDPRANLVVGVHGLVRDLRAYAGPSGTLVVDEPGEVLLTERITLDDLDTAAVHLKDFELAYAAAIAPTLAAITAWVREIGPVEAALTSLHDAVRDGAPAVPNDLLDAAGVAPEHLGDAVLLAAAGAIPPTARSSSPPLDRRAVILARASAARAADLGRASRLLDLLWRGVVERRAPFALRIDERNGERAATLVMVNPDLLFALDHERCVVLDANAGLHVAAIAKVLGYHPRFVDLAVVDGAPIRRTVLATGGATRRAWMPRGVPDWGAIAPALRAALAWAREDPTTRKLALIAAKEIHVGLAHALRPGAPETAKLVKESRLSRRALDRVRAELVPLLTAFPGEIVTGHYGALEGLDHMADCDATVTLGDPRPNLGDEAIKCEYLGLDLDGRLDALAAAELQQAHGRLRTIHRTRHGRQLHVGAVVPAGWRDVEVRRLPTGRPRGGEGGGGGMSGEALAEARVRAGMGVRELARALGVSPSTVARYESGERAVPDDVARAVLLLAPSVPETPSRDISSKGFREHQMFSGPLQGVSGTLPLQGVSGTPRVRRIDMNALLGAQEEPRA